MLIYHPEPKDAAHRQGWYVNRDNVVVIYPDHGWLYRQHNPFVVGNSQLTLKCLRKVQLHVHVYFHCFVVMLVRCVGGTHVRVKTYAWFWFMTCWIQLPNSFYTCRLSPRVQIDIPEECNQWQGLLDPIC